MSAQLLDGRKLSAQMRLEIKAKAQAYLSQGITPHLVVVLVGEDAASQIYVRNKVKACQEVGIKSTVLRLEAQMTQEALEDTIRELNADPLVHGILVQLPLPQGLSEGPVLELISPVKDVDGFHPVNAGRLSLGKPALTPCTPLGALEVLRRAGIPMAGKRAVIIGRSNIVGKPMAMLLLMENATVTVCHSRTLDLKQITREADILVCALGKARFVTGDMVKPGAAVLDVGINRVDGKVVGDVDQASVEPVAGFLTPVPGGLGPMTITMLLHNTLTALAGQVKQ